MCDNAITSFPFEHLQQNFMDFPCCSIVPTTTYKGFFYFIFLEQMNIKKKRKQVYRNIHTMLQKTCFHLVLRASTR